MTKNIVNIAANRNESSFLIDDKVFISSISTSVKLMYETLKSTRLCGVPCIILSSPILSKHTFRFVHMETYIHAYMQTYMKESCINIYSYAYALIHT